jgi:hypothetical protein
MTRHTEKTRSQNNNNYCSPYIVNYETGTIVLRANLSVCKSIRGIINSSGYWAAVCMFTYLLYTRAGKVFFIFILRPHARNLISARLVRTERE